MRTVPPVSQSPQRARGWGQGTLLALTVSLLPGWMCYVSRGAGPDAADFAPDDAVSEVAFTIRVGEEGDALRGPVALDLGLGFPLWLDPLTVAGEQTLAIGAHPQEHPDLAELAPGETATFVFRTEGEPGDDQLRTTAQLLDGVRISDIARVGVISSGEDDWVLGGYELTINGTVFTSREGINERALTRMDEVREELLLSRAELEEFAVEQDDLSLLKEAGLASPEELSQLESLDERARELERTMFRCEAVLVGVCPWYVDPDLQIPGRRGDGEIQECRVTIATAADHSNAQTSNYLYFRTGGKKYFFYPADNHFTAEANPQSFQLNLAAGPLEAADIRGFGVGMLAHDLPYADIPDRWHPQRLIVEVDGRTVYDSDAQPLDRRSLESIRVIPPAHRDADGEVHTNEPNPRECFVWLAGRAQGIDLENGGAVEIPGGVASVGAEPPDAATAEQPPPPETGDTEVASVGDEEEWPGETPVEPDPFPAFPPDDDTPTVSGGDNNWAPGGGWEPTGGGSMCPWGGGYAPGGWDGSGWNGGGWGGWNGGGWTGGGGGWTGGGPGGWPNPPPPGSAPAGNGDNAAWDLLVDRLVELIDAILEDRGRRDDDPEPIGAPPQIDNVQLVRNSQDARLFQVIWNVAGDESQIDHFEVSLWHVSPEQSQPLIRDLTPDEQREVAAGMHASEWIRPNTVRMHWYAYIQPMVVAVLKDQPDDSSRPTEVGAALPYVLADSTPMKQPRPQRVDDEATILRGTAADGAPAWMESVVKIGDLSLESDELTSNVVVKVPVRENTDRTIRYLVTSPFEPGTWGESYGLWGHVSVLQPPPDGRPVHLDIFSPGSTGGTPNMQLVSADGTQLIEILHKVDSREEEATPRMEFLFTLRAGAQIPGQTPRGAPGGDSPTVSDETENYCLVAICGLRWARRVSGGQ